METVKSKLKTTQESINQAVIKLDQAQLSTELSQIALDTAKADLNKYMILSPFDGIVLTSNYNPGEIAGSGAAVSIISKDFVIKTDVNETDINNVKIDQQVLITFDAYPNKSFRGKVSDISLISKNTSNIITYAVTVTPDDSAKSSLLYGLTTNLNIIAANAQNVLYVPVGAVYKQDGKQYVDTLPSGLDIKNTKDLSQYKKQVEVQTGISNFTNIEITSGLNEGDVVLISNTSRTNQQNTQNSGNNTQSSSSNVNETSNPQRGNTNTSDTSRTNTSGSGFTGSRNQDSSNTSSTNQ